MAKIDAENVDRSEVAKQATLRLCAALLRWLKLRRGIERTPTTNRGER